jgi:hypothetical protein
MASDKSKVYNAETVILVVCMKKKSFWALPSAHVAVDGYFEFWQLAGGG